MKPVLLVAVGGAIGSAARFLLMSGVQRFSHTHPFPWGTLAVNMLGCLAAGWLTGQAEKHAWLNDVGRLLLLTGFLGGFTTFSAWSVDTLRLLRSGETLWAAVYVGASVAIGLSACAAGFAWGSK